MKAYQVAPTMSSLKFVRWCKLLTGLNTVLTGFKSAKLPKYLKSGMLSKLNGGG